jgi:hypothetical protein
MRASTISSTTAGSSVDCLGSPGLVGEAGFELLRFRGYSYVEAPSSDGYMLSIADRGAEALLENGRIGLDLADALKAEARRRSEAGEFFGHIAYASLIARRAQ